MPVGPAMSLKKGEGDSEKKFKRGEGEIPKFYSKKIDVINAYFVIRIHKMSTV